MKVIVVGGGAAGMMAACAAAQNGANVTVIERNSFCGMKLNITGKGRCNLTNDCSPDELRKSVVTNGKFLYSAFAAMSSQDVMAFFEALGVSLKTERGNRVFPVSDRAKDISAALRSRMHRLGVTVRQDRVDEILTEKGCVTGVALQGGQILKADRVILAAGGCSYPKTGSDGSGYVLAQRLGHTITPRKPSLVPLIAEGPIPARLEGLSLKNVTFTVYKEKKQLFSEFGEMLFTGNGVSGPIVLSASAHLDRRNHTFPYQAYIDLKPALDRETLDKRIVRDFQQQKNKDFSNALSALLPAKIIPVVIEQSGIPSTQKVNAITKGQREALGGLLKAFPLTICGTEGWDSAIVTHGGISVKEVDPKTMQSKLVEGLYFAGEILDVDAYTGGFNLQIAWATGSCAGQAAAREEGNSSMKHHAIAIDGPAGAGKSTIAKALAEQLRYIYIDTGAMYRAIGLHALENGVDGKDAPAVTALLPEIVIELRFLDGGQHIFLNGEDVSGRIRTEAASIYASDVSAIPAVRAFLLEMQRGFAQAQDVIMDGRDIGTVVLPQADLKIFLTASSEARAHRRWLEQQAKGEQASYEEILAAIRLRDEQDSNRAVAPLKAAEDAVVVDTTELGLEESIRKVREVVKERLGV